MTVQHARERRRIGLRTADREHAGALALNFYQRLRADGWDATLRWWRGDLHDAKKSDVTVGEYIDAVTERSALRPKTLASYVAAFRQIAGEIIGESNRARRDGTKLRVITPEKIATWRTEFIRKRSATRSAKRAPVSRSEVSCFERANSSAPR